MLCWLSTTINSDGMQKQLCDILETPVHSNTCLARSIILILLHPFRQRERVRRKLQTDVMVKLKSALKVLYRVTGLPDYPLYNNATETMHYTFHELSHIKQNESTTAYVFSRLHMSSTSK
jgi:hypothetical protein